MNFLDYLFHIGVIDYIGLCNFLLILDHKVCYCNYCFFVLRSRQRLGVWLAGCYFILSFGFSLSDFSRKAYEYYFRRYFGATRHFLWHPLEFAEGDTSYASIHMVCFFIDRRLLENFCCFPDLQQASPKVLHHSR